MQPYHELNYKAGTRQKILLFELAAQAIITPNLETGLWQRGAYTSRVAKSLLVMKDTRPRHLGANAIYGDRTLDEQISDFEPCVLRLEADMKAVGRIEPGLARNKLNNLKKLKETVYATSVGI